MDGGVEDKIDFDGGVTIMQLVVLGLKIKKNPSKTSIFFLLKHPLKEHGNSYSSAITVHSPWFRQGQFETLPIPITALRM